MLKLISEWLKKTVFKASAYSPPMDVEPEWEDTGQKVEETERDRFVADAKAIIDHYTNMPMDAG